MVKVVCLLCGKEWTKPGDCQQELVSHGLCEPCEAIYDRYADGEITLEEAKAEAKAD